MNLSLDKNHVQCHLSNKWLKLGVDTYLLSNEDGCNEYDEIRCLCDLACNNICIGEEPTLLGYRKDIPDFFSNIKNE